MVHGDRQKVGEYVHQTVVQDLRWGWPQGTQTTNRHQGPTTRKHPKGKSKNWWQIKYLSLTTDPFSLPQPQFLHVLLMSGGFRGLADLWLGHWMDDCHPLTSFLHPKYFVVKEPASSIHLLSFISFFGIDFDTDFFFSFFSITFISLVCTQESNKFKFKFKKKKKERRRKKEKKKRIRIKKEKKKKKKKKRKEKKRKEKKRKRRRRRRRWSYHGLRPTQVTGASPRVALISKEGTWGRGAASRQASS